MAQSLNHHDYSKNLVHCPTPECSYVTGNKMNYYRHKKIHEESKPYSCEFCAYSTITGSSLKRHMHTHTKERPFTCELCKSKFRQKVHLERHIKYKHQEKTVKCPKCDYICASELFDLRPHMKRKHSERPINSVDKLICHNNGCNFVTSSNKDFQQHKKTHAQGPELKLFCELCSFVTDCESRLKRHLLVHTKERPYQCRFCYYRATQKEHMTRHIKSKHIKVVELEQEKLEADEKLDLSVVDSSYIFNNDSSAITGSSLEINNISHNSMGCLYVQTDHLNKTVSNHLTNMNKLLTPSDYTSQRIQQQVYCAPSSTLAKQAAINSNAMFLCHESLSFSQEMALQTATPATATSKTAEDDIFHRSNAGKVMAMTSKNVKLKKNDTKSNYSNKTKYFNCHLCTMSFHKVISLYKHIQSQHKVHEGHGFHCVLCDYRTDKKKNLLLHLRKHSILSWNNATHKQQPNTTMHDSSKLSHDGQIAVHSESVVDSIDEAVRGFQSVMNYKNEVTYIEAEGLVKTLLLGDLIEINGEVYKVETSDVVSDMHK